MARMRSSLLSVACVLAFTVPAVGNVARGASYPVLSSDFHHGDGVATRVMTVGIVTLENANAMRLAFDDWNLGQRSRVVLRSLLDGHMQHLNAETMPIWAEGSAYFNGNVVEVSLEVAPHDQDVFVSVADAIEALENEPGGPEPVRTICGPTDNRVVSSNPRVARLGGSDPSLCNGGGGCTAWLFSNGALLTAGHCGPGNNVLVEFNVPMSNSDGSLNHPGPQDQYRVDGSTVVNANSGITNDWSIFQVHPNTETGLLPVIAQGAFFRGSVEDLNPASIRITGYGYDDEPPGSCSWATTHKVQQTHAGTHIGYVDNGLTERFHRYRADTRPANSGSPIIINGTTLTLGIHTTGGCAGTDPENGANSGTSFQNFDLFVAISGFLGPNARYADIDHPAAVQVGTLFQPFKTVPAAFNSVPNNGTVFLIAGSYTAANGNAINYGGKNVLLRAPAGTVLIGN